jgi:hypothetical protein
MATDVLAAVWLLLFLPSGFRRSIANLRYGGGGDSGTKQTYRLSM